MGLLFLTSSEMHYVGNRLVKENILQVGETKINGRWGEKTKWGFNAPDGGTSKPAGHHANSR